MSEGFNSTEIITLAVEKETDEFKVPKLSLWEVFYKFLSFGLRAWGGAVPQIVLLKDELVLRDKWISIQQFNRVYAVYQVLPGPEATELCCYFGYLARGRSDLKNLIVDWVPSLLVLPF
jgi:chromate transport protein ChrA